MRRFITLIFLLFALSEISGQRPSLTLTFSAVNNTAWVQLDSVKVINRTQGGDTVLYYPDTVLVLDYQAGITEPHTAVEGFQVFQNYPNPVADQTTINLYIPSKDNVYITVTDVLGRVIIRSERILDEGLHSFRFVPGDGSLYFFTAQWMGKSSGIKILCEGMSSHKSASLEYQGGVASVPQIKIEPDNQNFLFSIGDELVYIGQTDTLESGMLDTPETSSVYTFQFATNIPCPGIPTVDYEGEVYNTRQIFSQCWLKENLNVGVLIPSTQEMTDNGIIEKYCYNNEPDSCNKYGGFYQWQEIMQYITQEGTQGICPPGWHVPLEEEWKVLEGSADSQYDIFDMIWNNYNSYRGFDAGINLRSAKGWFGGFEGADLYGFKAEPAGFCHSDGTFDNIGMFDSWWTSTEVDASKAWYRCVNFLTSKVGLYNYFGKDYGFSVRCLKND
jgi:uncharacterized protein (TIGR02145 family)